MQPRSNQLSETNLNWRACACAGTHTHAHTHSNKTHIHLHTNTQTHTQDTRDTIKDKIHTTKYRHPNNILKYYKKANQISAFKFLVPCVVLEDDGPCDTPGARTERPPVSGRPAQLISTGSSINTRVTGEQERSASVSLSATWRPPRRPL